MNERERADVQVLIGAALSFIEHMESGWDVDRAESEDLRREINIVLGHVYYPDAV